MANYQYCSLCESRTGRCSEDQIVVELPNGATIGPICEECYSGLSPIREIDDLKAKLARAEAELADFHALGREAALEAKRHGGAYPWFARKVSEIIAKHQEAK